MVAMQVHSLHSFNGLRKHWNKACSTGYILSLLLSEGVYHLDRLIICLSVHDSHSNLVSFLVVISMFQNLERGKGSTTIYLLLLLQLLLLILVQAEHPVLCYT